MPHQERREMRPKPRFLSQPFGDQFTDPAIVASYDLRPPYPPEVFDTLQRLVDNNSISILDVGCGTGEIARSMARRGFRVDAVDPSPGMIAKGQDLAGGDASGLTWIPGKAEDAQLMGPYGLIVAGASLHWMDWDVVIPRFGNFLGTDGVLAIVDQYQLPMPWESGKRDLCQRFSTNREWRPYNVVDELVARRLFKVIGEHETATVSFSQSVFDYVESFHSRNGFSRDRMPGEDAATFDRELTSLVQAHTGTDDVQLQIVGTITWGLPGHVTR
jgi:SAM-dependent methyltransferase